MTDVSGWELEKRFGQSFATAWANRTDISGDGQNRHFDVSKVSGDHWARLFILGAAGGEDTDTGIVRLSQSVTPHHFREEGLITVEVYARVGVGLETAHGHMDVARAWLQSNPIEDVLIGNLSAVRNLGDDGAWVQLSLSAEWKLFTDRAA